MSNVASKKMLKMNDLLPQFIFQPNNSSVVHKLVIVKLKCIVYMEICIQLNNVFTAIKNQNR